MGLGAAMKQLAGVIREPEKFPGKEMNNSTVTQDFGWCNINKAWG